MAAIDTSGEKGTVILKILKSVYVAIGAVAIGAGAWIVFGHLTGKLLKRWPIVFLKCALVASASVLLFPLYHFLPTYWAIMFGIYISGMSALAWCKYRLVGIWTLEQFAKLRKLFSDVQCGFFLRKKPLDRIGFGLHRFANCSNFRIEHHAHSLSEHSGRAAHIFEMLVST